MKNDYSYKDQMRRAAMSIASNIAEGNDRESNKEFIRFLYIAKGSCSELITQIIIGKQIGYIDIDKGNELEEKVTKVSHMIGALIKSLYKVEEI